MKMGINEDDDGIPSLQSFPAQHAKLEVKYWICEECSTSTVRWLACEMTHTLIFYCQSGTVILLSLIIQNRVFFLFPIFY